MEMKKWYAVYTRPRSEKKVADLLQKKKIENYCPLNTHLRQWADRKKVVFEPLFTSYVFVCTTEKEHLPVLQTDGVLNFVYWLNKPAIIHNKEIEIIRDFLETHSTVRLEKTEVSVDDMVRISSGPLIYNEGTVIEVKNKYVRVYLPSLGYSMIADIKKANVELIHSNRTLTKKII